MDRLDPSEMAIAGVDVRVLQACGSTNSELLKLRSIHDPVLLAAESQSAGRGRRGRRWHSRPGQAVTFSMARRIARPVRELAALSLVAGVAAATALRQLGAAGTSLKWPNDLVADGAKLGWILVETRANGAAPLAVIGIGINYLADTALQKRLRRPITSLSELMSPLPGRNRIIASIARELIHTLVAFEQGGLDALRGAWLALDAHAGQRLRVRLADGRTVSGVAAGLAPDGGLQLRTRSGVRAIRSGRVVAERLA